MKTMLTVTISIFVFALPLAVQAQAGHGSVQVTYPEAEQPLWQRDSSYAAAYPRQLAMNGVTGCAVYNLEFNETGEIQNKSRVAVSRGRNLARETERLIDTWDWQPADPQAAQAGEVQVRVDYCMASGTEDEVIAQCQQQTEQTCS